MMATQPYPSPHLHGVPNAGSRNNIYRINATNPSPSPGPPSSGGMYHPHQPQPQQYMYQHQPEHTGYGLVTPPASTGAQFGSPLMPGGRGPYGGSASGQWGMNGLVSPMSSDGMALPGYYVPPPMTGSDPHCAAPLEVFAGQPLSREPMAADALGFTGGMPMHHHQMYGVPMPGKPHLLLGPDGQPAQPEIKKRSRTAQACERCRIRKARCFGGNPCNRCQKRRFTCEFSTAVRQRGPNKPSAFAPADGTSAPVTVNSTANDTPSAPGSSTIPQKALKIDTKSTRRHSADSVGKAPPSIASLPPGPAKGYSTNDIPLAQCVTPDSYVNMMPLPTPDYLGVPNGISYQSQRPQTDHGYYGTRSPVFSLDGEYPISPATNFSPAAAFSPVANLHLPQGNNYHHQDHDQSQACYTTATA